MLLFFHLCNGFRLVSRFRLLATAPAEVPHPVPSGAKITFAAFPGGAHVFSGAFGDYLARLPAQLWSQEQPGDQPGHPAYEQSGRKLLGSFFCQTVSSGQVSPMELPSPGTIIF